MQIKNIYPSSDLSNLTVKFIHYDTSTLLSYSNKLVSIIQIKFIHNNGFLKAKNQLYKDLKTNLINSYDEDIGFYLKNKKIKIEKNSPLLQHINFDYLNYTSKFLSDNYYENLDNIDFENQIFIIIVCKLNDNFNKFNFFQNLLQKRIFNIKSTVLMQGVQKLTKVKNEILNNLAQYQPKLLSAKTLPNGQITSELINFYYSLLDLPKVDFEHFSHFGYLPDAKYFIEEEYIKIIYQNYEKYLGFIAIKEMCDIDQDRIFELFSQNFTFDLTEILIPSNSKDIKDKIDDIKKISNGNKNINFDLLQNYLTGSEFYKVTTIITLIDNNSQNLIKHVQQMSEILTKIGISHVKEEVLNEYNLYWHFPTNFTKLNLRQNIKPKENIADNLILNSGHGELWNEKMSYICILKTIHNSNFYFNFFQNISNQNNISNKTQKHFNLFIENLTLLRFIVAMSNHNLEKSIQTIYFCQNNQNLSFCKLLDFKQLQLFNIFIYLEEQNIDIFKTFLFNLIKFGDLMLDFNSTVRSVLLEDLNNENYLINQENLKENNIVSTNANLTHNESQQSNSSTQIAIDEFLKFVLLLKERVKIKKQKAPTIKMIYEVYKKMHNFNEKIGQILEFFLEKYDFLELNEFQNISSNSNYYIDVTKLTEEYFYEKFYPKNDGRRIEQFQQQNKFHKLFIKNYIEIFLKLIATMKDKNSNKLSIIMENAWDIFSQFEFIEIQNLFHLLNNQAINIILHDNFDSNQESQNYLDYKNYLLNYFDLVFEKKSRDNNSEIKFKSKAETLELNIKKIMDLSDIINYSQDDANKILNMLDTGSSYSDCINHLIKFYNERNFYQK